MKFQCILWAWQKGVILNLRMSNFFLNPPLYSKNKQGRTSIFSVVGNVFMSLAECHHIFVRGPISVRIKCAICLPPPAVSTFWFLLWQGGFSVRSGPTLKILKFCLFCYFLNGNPFCWPVNQFGLYTKIVLDCLKKFGLSLLCVPENKSIERLLLVWLCMRERMCE